MSVITDRPAAGRSFDPTTATAILVTIVLGGIYTGYFTAAEAGAVEVERQAVGAGDLRHGLDPFERVTGHDDQIGEFPRLQRLELLLGEENYGFDGSVGVDAPHAIIPGIGDVQVT